MGNKLANIETNPGTSSRHLWLRLKIEGGNELVKAVHGSYEACGKAKLGQNSFPDLTWCSRSS